MTEGEMSGQDGRRALRRALERDEFELYYQPRSTSKRCLVGCEALLRWQHRARALLPERFIALAEETGSYRADRRVGAEGAPADQARAWQKDGFAPIAVW